MYDLRDYRPKKWYGKVKQGWYRAKIYAGGLRKRRSKRGNEYQYIKIDFEIIDEESYRDVLVPGFFFYKEGEQKPDPLLGKLCFAISLVGDYRNDSSGFFNDIVGRGLMIKVVHRYKKAGNSRIRRERADDFRRLLEAEAQFFEEYGELIDAQDP